MNEQALILIASGTIMFAVIGALSLLAHYYTLNSIKSKTVGDGQYGTARFTTEDEIRKTYTAVTYDLQKWGRGQNLPKEQGLVVGCRTHAGGITALVDTGDIHCLMMGAAGVGKTANFLYPNIKYACASGMSFLCTDTKSDLFRNYAGIAKDCYGYHISVLDLRNPTRSDGDNILSMVNKYMDAWLADPENLALKAKAEKYAKITAKTIICSSGEDASSYGQNAFFYDSEMEQILCFDGSLDTETFCNEKSAIFIVLPKEDNTKYFMVSLFIQQIYREMLTVADEHGGKLPNRVMIYADEVGTIPKIQSMEMIFSSGRSSRLSMVPIIQSYAQFEKNYGATC